MKKSRGMSLVEVLTGAGLMMLITLGTMSLMATGLTYVTRTSTDLTLSGKNAQGLRWMSEYARMSMSASIVNSGKEVDFTIPARSTTVDSFTGEKEYIYPLTGDGVVRGFKVDFVAGTLTDLHSNKVIVKNITATDPDPHSSTYNQAYTPFAFSIVGSHKVIVMQLMTKQKINGYPRYARMKETVLLRNT
jgi:hypothetical protein